MGALGVGLMLMGYGLAFYGLALATGQHMNLLYVLFHAGDKGAKSAQSQ